MKRVILLTVIFVLFTVGCTLPSALPAGFAPSQEPAKTASIQPKDVYTPKPTQFYAPGATLSPLFTPFQSTILTPAPTPDPASELN